jgi:hypothetical protein
MTERPHTDVAVIMRRERLDNRWQPWRWSLDSVVVNEPAFGTDPRRLINGADEQRWLFPGFRVELFRDDAEGYHLNVTSPAPCWFVMWRMDEDCADGTEPLARPVAVSLSYHEAGRWLDAQETVEQVPAPELVLEAMRAFVAEHYQMEPKRRKRPDSFRSLQDRFGNPASVSTDKQRGGGRGGAAAGGDNPAGVREGAGEGGHHG